MKVSHRVKYPPGFETWRKDELADFKQTRYGMLSFSFVMFRTFCFVPLYCSGYFVFWTFCHKSILEVKHKDICSCCRGPGGCSGSFGRGSDTSTTCCSTISGTFHLDLCMCFVEWVIGLTVLFKASIRCYYACKYMVKHG